MVADEETLFRCVSGDAAKGHEVLPGNPKGLPPNPAHALVVTTPQIAKTGGAWGRVRAALARVATETGWAIEPS